MRRPIAVFALALSMAFAGSAGAATFDGSWSVLIVTEKGDCDKGYRYDLGVSDGRVIYRGGGPVKVSGTVSPKGAVKVRIMVGENAAQATGRLAGSSGSGTWEGAGMNEKCTGRWEAERR